jgi:septal ring factor EnvC (AmiA/AmiB activator)
MGGPRAPSQSDGVLEAVNGLVQKVNSKLDKLSQDQLQLNKNLKSMEEAYHAQSKAFVSLADRLEKVESELYSQRREKNAPASRKDDRGRSLDEPCLDDLCDFSGVK